MQLPIIFDSLHPWETDSVQTHVRGLAQRLADDYDIYWYGLQNWNIPDVGLLGLLKDAKVFAFPSRREGFRINGFEILVCGTPVVTINQNRNVTADLVNDGETGIVTAPTPTAFIDGIPCGIDFDGVSCCTAAVHYDWNRLLGEIETIYQKLPEGS